MCLNGQYYLCYVFLLPHDFLFYSTFLFTHFGSFKKDLNRSILYFDISHFSQRLFILSSFFFRSPPTCFGASRRILPVRRCLPYPEMTMFVFVVRVYKPIRETNIWSSWGGAEMHKSVFSEAILLWALHTY